MFGVEAGRILGKKSNMKFIIPCLVIFASIQFIGAKHDGGCEITEAALAELAELRAIVDQLKTLVQTVIGQTAVEPEPACPEACTFEYAPVCGTDRKTYSNGCVLTVAQCNNEDGTLELAYEGPCTTDEDEITDTVLAYTWKEATLSWTAPLDEVFGYYARVLTPAGNESTRLSAIATSFDTSVSPNLNYTIEITPIMGDGPGTTYSTGIFIPACPMVCTAQYDPVCATDGNTYGNMCAFETAQCLSGDETLAMDYTGPCDPCRDIICDAIDCPEGLIVNPYPLPEECCGGCIDGCTLIACSEPQCDDGFETGLIEGECCPGCLPVDPCRDIICDAIDCPEGLIVNPHLLPEECCGSCIDGCTLIACSEPQCDDGFETGLIEGECCPGCIPVDPCRDILCDVPVCLEGLVVSPYPLDGECCVGCIDECELIACDEPQCGDGYEVTSIDGECCDGCIRLVFEDCSAAQAAGMTTNGAYLIQPIGVVDPVEVLCDFQNDGGRWTVILLRAPSDINFLRDYDDYVEGFGDVNEAYWIGLETLYRLNKQGNKKMFVGGRDYLGTTASGQYNIFKVKSGADDYELETIVGFRGTADADIGNALAYNKGAAFSARDRDNDGASRDCAAELGGGWWYKGKICTRANPLGEFLEFEDFAFENGIFWAPFRGKGKSLQNLELKIRPVN